MVELLEVDDVELEVEVVGSVVAVPGSDVGDIVVLDTLLEAGAEDSSLLHAASTTVAVSAAMFTRVTARRRFIAPVCQPSADGRRQRMRVSASRPPSTSTSREPTTSTVVIDALSRLRMTRRSSPTAAPMTALIAMKWLNTTHPPS